MKAMTAVNYGGPEDDSPIHRRRFTLAEAADAMRYVEEGRTAGKIVVTVGSHRPRWRGHGL
jgi:hypothetical protein